MTKNYLYCDRIGERIKELLDRELPEECARNVSTGDFSILPEPHLLTGYLPAVLIDSTDVEIIDVNEGLDIVRMSNRFEISYLYPYTYKAMADIPGEAKANIRMIANLLMNHRTLEGFEIPATEEEAGGLLMAGAVSRIRFDSAETKLFRAIDVPMAIGVIEYAAEFRTYQARRGIPEDPRAAILRREGMIAR